MARPLRLEIPDGIYHVTTRGLERTPIFRDDDDRHGYLELLAEVARDHRWRTLTYCLMDNHVHLVLQTPESNLSRDAAAERGVRAAVQPAARPRRTPLPGSLRSPPRAGRALPARRRPVRRLQPRGRRTLFEPSQWAFSSHRAALGEAPDGPADVETLLSYLGEPPEDARTRYRELTEGVADDALPPHPLVIGEDAFVERALASLDPRPGVPGRYLRPPRPPLDILLGEARDAGALARAQAAGYSLRELATYLGCNASTVSRRIRRRGLGATSGT